MTFYDESKKGRLARGNCDTKGYTVYGFDFLHHAYAFVCYLFVFWLVVFETTRIIVTGCEYKGKNI